MTSRKRSLCSATIIKATVILTLCRLLRSVSDLIAEFVCVKILRTQSGVERTLISYAPRNNVVNRYGIR